MKRTRISVVSSVALIAVLLLASCAGGQVEGQSNRSTPTTESGQSAVETQPSSPGSGWDLSPRSNDAGNVVIDVEPGELGADQDAWEFDVALSTHSVSLDYDLTQLAVLRCERDQEHEPVSWEGSPPGGHHRQGVLHFTPLDHPTSFLELVIRDVAGVSERVFRWENQEAATAPVPELTQASDAAPTPEQAVSSAEVASIYQEFVCPCCGQDIGSCTCGMAAERRGVIDRTVAQGASQSDIHRVMFQTYGAGGFFDQELAAQVQDEVLASLPADRPVLSIEPTKLDLGTVPITDGSVSATFTVRNDGQSDLTITSMETTCGCTTAVLESAQGISPVFGANASENPTGWSAVLAPGEEASLIATFDTLFHGPDATGEFRRAVSVISDDPLNSRADVSFVVEVTQ
ncbi:MAG: DUF1573 domain-containing protein [Anaerolineae bacterium]